MTLYLPRTAWTTSGPAKPLSAMPPNPVGIAVHWPGTTRPIGSTSQSNMAARLEGYRRFHVNGRGWNDIAYQVAIDQDGRVWDLRGIEHESAANGDQSVNRTYLACLFMLGPGEQPSTAMLRAFTDWRRDKALRRYPSLRRYPTATGVVGHRDIRPTGGTDCPGPITEALIKAGRLTATAPAAPQEDDDMLSKEAQDWIEARLDAHDAYVLANLKATIGREVARQGAQLAALSITGGATDKATLQEVADKAVEEFVTRLNAAKGA